MVSLPFAGSPVTSHGKAALGCRAKQTLIRPSRAAWLVVLLLWLVALLNYLDRLAITSMRALKPGPCPTRLFLIDKLPNNR